MRKTIFFHFLPSKAEGEEYKSNGNGSGRTLRWEVVEIRGDPPQLFQFFPWEINKVLTANDVGHFGSLELSPEQVHNYIFKYWDDKTVARVTDRGEQVPIVINDLDTGTEHSLFLRKWASEDNFSIYACWMKEFVVRRELKAGMLIGLYWHTTLSAFRFSLLNKLEDW